MVVHLAFLIIGGSRETTRAINVEGTLAGSAGGPVVLRAGEGGARAPAPDRGRRAPRPGAVLLRPPIVLGPHVVGAKELLPGPLAPLARRLQGRIGQLPVPVSAFIPDVPVQFIHEDDVGSALL